MQYKPTDEKHSYGYKTIGIPGVVAGLLKIQKENGVLPIQKVMEPAINYAENGFRILPGEAYRQQISKEIFEQYEGTKTHFLNADGTLIGLSADGKKFIKDKSEELNGDGYMWGFDPDASDDFIYDIQDDWNLAFNI